MLCECLRKRKHQSVASPMSVWLSHYLCGPNKHRIIFVGVVTQINLCPSATPKKWLVCPIFYGVPQRPSTKTAPIPTPLRHKEIDKKKREKKIAAIWAKTHLHWRAATHLCDRGEWLILPGKSSKQIPRKTSSEVAKQQWGQVRRKIREKNSGVAQTVFVTWIPI